MTWNWQLPEWPDFRYDRERLQGFEETFLKQGGMLLGAFRHLLPLDETELIAEAATSEAMSTSAIEGEVLDRQSVRSSVLHQLGLGADPRQSGLREVGIAQMTLDTLRSPTPGLSHERLWAWHRMLMPGRADLGQVGAYRTHEGPMQVVSGPPGRDTVHFEAPPSSKVPAEMERFLSWFEQSTQRLPALVLSGLAHLYFESIHPFEEGNGRIGRAISEVALARSLGAPCLTMLSTEIESRQKAYYAELEYASKGLEATDWLTWFAETVLAAQRRTQSWVDFLIAKSRMMDRLRGAINSRQESALLRVFREGPGGFVGGLSSGNYQTITGAPPATAGRDLAELVELGALIKTGTGKGTRYWLQAL